MNKKEKMFQINSTSKLLKFQDRMHKNCIRSSLTENDQHFVVKCLICRELNNMNKEFITEARFENGKGRADVLVLDDGVALEILCSEKEENIKNKKNNYPVSVEYFKITPKTKAENIRKWVRDVLC